MDKFHIVGPTRLAGRVQPSGAKNAALPALAASLLLDGETLTLHRMPRVRDIRTMMRLLEHLGIGCEEIGGGGGAPTGRTAVRVPHGKVPRCCRGC